MMLKYFEQKQINKRKKLIFLKATINVSATLYDFIIIFKMYKL